MSEDIAPLREELVHLAQERIELERQIASARREIASQQLDKLRLEKQLATIESSSRDLSRRYTEVEQQNSDLTNLYVASNRLHESLDRSEVLAAIQEIIINLVGSEELAVFELNEDGTALELAGSFGIEPKRFDKIPLTEGGTLLRGEKMAACVPLMLGDRTVGAVALFSLLPQKAGLERIDLDLLELLRAQAGLALYCTRVVQKRSETP
jgi:nitrate/nitrite-specific signal transduction histidine kinase